MKKLGLLFIGLVAVFLSSCSGSDTYRGSWKAINAQGAKFEIIFDAKNFTIKDSTGKTENIAYTQYSVVLKNAMKTYGIELENGNRYKIYFPNLESDSMGTISRDNGQLLYTISKKSL